MKKETGEGLRINTREICHVKVINDFSSSRVKDFFVTSAGEQGELGGRGAGVPRTLENRRRMKHPSPPHGILWFCTTSRMPPSFCGATEKENTSVANFFHTDESTSGSCTDFWLSNFYLSFNIINNVYFIYIKRQDLRIMCPSQHFIRILENPITQT
jgi:hypothetical protein